MTKPHRIGRLAVTRVLSALQPLSDGRRVEAGFPALSPRRASVTCGQPVSSSPRMTPRSSQQAASAPFRRRSFGARPRGAVMKVALLADSDMLNTAAIADLLGMSEEGLRLKRKRHEIIDCGIRYPA